MDFESPLPKSVSDTGDTSAGDTTASIESETTSTVSDNLPDVVKYSSGGKPIFEDKFWLSLDHIKALGIPESNAVGYRGQFYHMAFGVDSFYSLVPEYTFPTAIVPLTFEEATSFVDAVLKKTRRENGTVDSNYFKNVLKAPVFDGLVTRINENIQTHFRSSKKHGFFAKLNTRSPKDALIYQYENSALQNMVKSQLDGLGSDSTPQSQVFSMLAALNKSQCVSNGEQVMLLFFESLRIFEDLNGAKQYPKHLFKHSIVLREFDDEIPNHPQGEFRCFVYKRKLNAISQYFTRGYWESLAKNKDSIAKKIQIWWEMQIRDKLVHDSYVIDIFMNQDTIKIIELNSFHTWTGANFFSWRKDRDLLMTGPFEIRV